MALLCIQPLLIGGCSKPPGPATNTAATERQRAPDLEALKATGYGGWDPLDETVEGEPGAGSTDADRSSEADPVPYDRMWADDRSTIRIVNPEGRVVESIVVPGRNQVEFARPLAGGRILALSVDEGLTLLEADGSVVWTLDLPAHHEALVVPRPDDVPGTRLFAVATHTPRAYGGRTVRFDEVLFVEESTGHVANEAEWPTWDSFLHRDALDRAASSTPHPLSTSAHQAAAGSGSEAVYDYFHLNGLAFDGEGEMVVCLRNVSMIAGVDLETGVLRWSVGEGTLDWPHAPSIVRGPRGERRILAFDNGTHRGWSRAMEFVPESGEITWTYRGTEDRPLWSRVRGFAERLPGGNTLITESERGRVLEVDRGGHLVWEFKNPEVQGGPEGISRRRIYRMCLMR